MKPPKKAKKSGAPAKGYKWKYETSGKIPNPEMAPVSPKKVKLKAMDMTFGGSDRSGKGYTKKEKKVKAKSL